MRLDCTTALSHFFFWSFQLNEFGRNRIADTERLLATLVSDVKVAAIAVGPEAFVVGIKRIEDI